MWRVGRVRGADVAYYDSTRLPKGPLPAGYGPEVPELVIEVRSSGDSWRDILLKVGEYLTAGVLKVIVLDPRPRKAHVYSAEQDCGIGNQVYAQDGFRGGLASHRPSCRTAATGALTGIDAVAPGPAAHGAL